MSFLQKWAFNLMSEFVGLYVRSIGLPTLSTFAALLGRAFGPEGCRHFSELTMEEQDALVERVPDLDMPHTDWPKGLNWVPRWLTCWVMPNDEAPALLPESTTLPE